MNPCLCQEMVQNGYILLLWFGGALIRAMRCLGMRYALKGPVIQALYLGEERTSVRKRGGWWDGMKLRLRPLGA